MATMGARTRRARTRLGNRYDHWRTDRLARDAGRITRRVDSGGSIRLAVDQIEEGVVQDGIYTAARRLFYPNSWDRSHARKPPIVEHTVECETEADIRDMRYVASYDAVVIRL